MLKLNLVSVMKQRGIENRRKFLCSLGIPYRSSVRLLNNQKKTIPFEWLENICIALHCTPNDIIAWQPADGSTIVPGHPMHKLRAGKSQPDIVKKLRTLPLEKLKALNHYLEALDKQDAEPARDTRNSIL